jgi:hypothetical protein
MSRRERVPMHTRSKRYRRRQRARLRRAAEHAAREAGQVNENRLVLHIAKCLQKFRAAPIGAAKIPLSTPVD